MGMKTPQTWQAFKFQVGLLVIYAAIIYSILITALVIFFGQKVCENQALWSLLNTIISTVMGWLLAKASTIIDYIYGAAVKPPPIQPNNQGGSTNVLQKITPTSSGGGTAGPVPEPVSMPTPIVNPPTESAEPGPPAAATDS